MKKTSKMGRPKSDKPLKDNLATIRMTGDVMKKIKETYGSVQKFFDVVSKALPIFALVIGGCHM